MATLINMNSMDLSEADDGRIIMQDLQTGHYWIEISNVPVPTFLESRAKNIMFQHEGKIFESISEDDYHNATEARRAAIDDYDDYDWVPEPDEDEDIEDKKEIEEEMLQEKLEK